MATNRRIKSDKLPLKKIPDWLHADEYVRRVGALQMQRQELEATAQEQIDKVKDDLKKQVEGLDKKINLWVESLGAFAAERKSEFGALRSKKLDHGKIGWHKSTSINIKKTTLGLIKKIFSHRRQKQFILIKESVSKDALAKLKDEDLAKVGARREEKDVFFVEPDKIEAADYSE